MKKLVSFLFALALVVGVALALYGLAISTPPQADGTGFSPAARVTLPQTFVLIDIRPGIQDAYYRCPETFGGWQNNDNHACEKTVVNGTFNGSVVGPWSGFQNQMHLLGEPYFNNPVVPWAKDTMGLAGKIYIFGAEADGEARTFVPEDPAQDRPIYHLGTFKKGVDTVIPFDGLYSDYQPGAGASPRDAMTFLFNARLYFRVEITAYYNAAATPTATVIPTDTPVPPTATPTNTPAPPTPTPLAEGCQLFGPNKVIVCVTNAP